MPPIAASCNVIVQKSLGRGNEPSSCCCLVLLTGQTGTVTVSRPRLVPLFFLPHIPIYEPRHSYSLFNLPLLLLPFFFIHTHIHVPPSILLEVPRAFLLVLPAERLTTENLWNLTLDMPVRPKGNDRGTASPAQVLDRAASLWWGYPLLSFFSWFFSKLLSAGQRAAEEKKSHYFSGMPLIECQLLYCASLVVKVLYKHGFLCAHLLVPALGSPNTSCPQLCRLHHMAKKEERGRFLLVKREQCPLFSPLTSERLQFELCNLIRRRTRPLTMPQEGRLTLRLLSRRSTLRQPPHALIFHSFLMYALLFYLTLIPLSLCSCCLSFNPSLIPHIVLLPASKQDAL